MFFKKKNSGYPDNSEIVGKIKWISVRDMPDLIEEANYYAEITDRPVPIENQPDWLCKREIRCSITHVRCDSPDCRVCKMCDVDRNERLKTKPECCDVV